MGRKIKNIKDLRDHAIGTLEKLEDKKIDISEAGVTAKLYENVLSSVKTEMEYNKMIDKTARIAFMDDAKDSLLIEAESKSPKLLKGKT